MKKIILLLLTALSLGASAQDTLQEVVVTSIRSSEDKPITQTTIPVKQFRKFYQGQDVPVILNFTSPSIQFTSDGGNWSGYMYYRLRGVDQTRVNATLNGVPLNEPEDQGAYFSNYQDFFSNVSSVQIQRGVGTSSTGSASYIGSLNFQSPNLSDSSYTRLELGTGSFNTNRFSLVTNTGLKNGWGTYVRYSRISSDGYRENSGTLGNTIFVSTGYQDSKQSLKYTMFWGNSQNQMAWLPSSEVDISNNRRHNPLSRDERDNFTQNLNILSYTKSISSKFSYNVTGFYNQLNGMYDVQVAPDMLKYQLRSEFTGFSANLNFGGARFDGTVGLNYSDYKRRHKMGLSPMYTTNQIHNNLGDKDQFSNFVKLNYKVTDKFSLFTDLQYRSVKFTYFEVANHPKRLQSEWKFWNPKFGFNYINKAHRVYGYYGVSNREPNRTDIFSFYRNNIDPDHLPYDTAVKYGWNQVRPETVQDYELGYNYNNKTHKFAVVVFWMQFRNGLLPVGELNSIGLPINTSVGSSYRRGVELEYTFSKSNFNFFLASTIMDSKIQSGDLKGNQMLLTPNVVINSNISYSIRNWNFMVLNKYVSQSYLTNQNTKDYLPEYIVTNLNISHSNKRRTIGLNVNNLFDQKYFNSGLVTFDTRQYFVAAPRNIFLNLIINF